MTYQESHFPSNQADFRLLLGMVAFSPSSPLPKALSCLPCDVCPIFCHSGVICEQGEPVRGSSAVCHSQCWFILRMLPWAQHWGLIVAAALCGCHWHEECRAREELCPFRAHTLTAVPCRSTHTNSQPCPSWRSALFSTPFSFVTCLISPPCAWKDMKQGWRVLSLHAQIHPGDQQKCESILLTPACIQTVKNASFHEFN